MIQYAVLMFPSVILPLLDKAGIQVDTKVKFHNYFNNYAEMHQSRALKLLCDLYVWRTHHVWKEPTVPSWLEGNVSKAISKIAQKESVIADYADKRKKRYTAAAPRSVLRHLVLVDEKDLSINFPPVLSHDKRNISFHFLQSIM